MQTIKRKIGPSKNSTNSEVLPANLIYRKLKIDEVFKDRDICDKFPELYEHDRMIPVDENSEFKSWMNERFSEEYTNNLFFNRQDKQKEEINKDFKIRYSEFIKDLAHVSLFYVIWKKLNENKNGNLIFDSEVPEDRFFLVQAGIGTGKTTMLKYFANHVLDKALEIEFPENKSCVLFVDFQVGFSKEIKIERGEIYNRLKRELKKKYPELDTKTGRFEISKEEIDNKMIDIELASNEEEAVLEIVRETKDDFIFVCRALKYLSKKRHVVLIVFDNADLVFDANEKLVFAYLNELLFKVPEAYGIISLREYSLNNLGQLKSMSAYYYLKSLHITTPSIKGILRRRFEKVADILDNDPPPVIPFSELGGMEITMSSYRDFLRKWQVCFLDEKEVTNWMINLSNCNIRYVMKIIRAVMGSAFVDVKRILSEYYNSKEFYNKTKKGKPWIRNVTSEEFLKLLMLGNMNDYTSTIYKDRNDALVQNIFDWNGEIPPGRTSLSGRYPLLIKYRIMHYFGSARFREIKDFFDYFEIYGYSKDELANMLQWFIDHYFLESKDGTSVSCVKELMPTRKLGFYIHRFSKFIIVLENFRNDAFLTYENETHFYGTSLIEDLNELFQFYLEILDYECQEYSIMKSSNALAKYASIIGRQPISWRLLKSCRNRIMQLKSSIKIFEKEQITNLMNSFNKTRNMIITKSENDMLLPRLANENYYRCPSLKESDFI